jgi:hypothetical protein
VRAVIKVALVVAGYVVAYLGASRIRLGIATLLETGAFAWVAWQWFVRKL